MLWSIQVRRSPQGAGAVKWITFLVGVLDIKQWVDLLFLLLFYESLTMLLSSRDPRFSGREGEGRMVDEGRELGLPRDSTAATPSSTLEGTACWCKCKFGHRSRYIFKVSFSYYR